MKNTKSTFGIVCSVLIGIICTYIALFFVFKLTPDNDSKKTDNNTIKHRIRLEDKIKINIKI